MMWKQCAKEIVTARTVYCNINIDTLHDEDGKKKMGWKAGGRKDKEQRQQKKTKEICKRFVKGGLESESGV